MYFPEGLEATLLALLSLQQVQILGLFLCIVCRIDLLTYPS